MLVIDEAQSLPRELLEEIRLLANIETNTEKLLPVVLAGQPELAERLNEPSLRQLKQRVALRCELRTADAQETVGLYRGPHPRTPAASAVRDVHAGGRGAGVRALAAACHARSA